MMLFGTPPSTRRSTRWPDGCPAVVTRGAKGSVVVTASGRSRCPPPRSSGWSTRPAPVTSSRPASSTASPTGATRGGGPARRVCAAEVISHVGARPQADLRALAVEPDSSPDRPAPPVARAGSAVLGSPMPRTPGDRHLELGRLGARSPWPQAWQARPGRPPHRPRPPPRHHRATCTARTSPPRPGARRERRWAPGLFVLVDRTARRRLQLRHLQIGDHTPITASDHLRLASVSKMYSGAVALALVADGTLHLSEPVAASCPAYPGPGGG